MPPRPLRSSSSSPARRRRGTPPRARATPRAQAGTTLSGAAPAGAALSGNFAVTAQLGGRVATCQPRTFSIPGASLPEYSRECESGIPGSYRNHGIHEPSSRLCCPGGIGECESGIPGSYRNQSIHEPSIRLCCPGGSFEKPIGKDSDCVPMPKTARPEGGCLIIHLPYHYPWPFWLKRYQREELDWHRNK